MNYREKLYADYSSHFDPEKTPPSPKVLKIFEKLHSPFLNAPSTASIAEIGCGKGEWLIWLASRGYSNLCGIDLAPELLRYLKEQGIPCHQGNGIEFFAERKTSFDLIHGRDVIEHMTKDEAFSFCTSTHQALRENGELWLSTFNAQAPLSNFIRWGDFTHELGLTPSSAYQLLSAAGFKDVRIFGMHVPSDSFKSWVRGLLCRIIDKIGRILLQIRYGKPVRNEFMTCLPDLFIIAKKTSPL
jgi:SAM-dependent methyltransferase